MNRTHMHYSLLLICLGWILLSPPRVFAQAPVLKHAYTFDDGTASDEVGGTHAILQGYAKVENGMLVTGPGQYLELPAQQINLSSYSAISLEAFVIAGETNGDFTMLSYFGNRLGTYGVDYLFQSLLNGGGSKTALSCYGQERPSWEAETWVRGHALKDGKPHHVVTTLDSTTLRFYLDGVLIGTATNTAFPKNTIANIGSQVAYLCKGGFENDPTWQGAIDRFNIYEGVLDSVTIRAAAQAYAPEMVTLAQEAGNTPYTDVVVDATGEFEQPITGKAIFFAELIPTEDDGNNRVDEMLVFSDVPMMEWGHFSTMLRFSFHTGYVDVYDLNREVNNENTKIPVEIGEVYQCWVAVDVPANTYTVYAKTARDSQPVLIYANALFRKKVTALTRWSVIHNRQAEDDVMTMNAFAQVGEIGAFPEGYVAAKSNLFTIADDPVPAGARVIDNPRHGVSQGRMQLRKIVRTDTTTELYFHTTYTPGRWIRVGDGLFLREGGSEEKLLIKRAEGIAMGSQHHLSARGFAEYKLVFPAVADTTRFIDYGEANEQGSWYIYNIELSDPAELVQWALEGHWHNALTGDWELTLLPDKAIYQGKRWAYQSQPTGTSGVLQLERPEARVSLPYSFKKQILKIGTKGNQIALSQEARYANVKQPTNPPVFGPNLLQMDTAILSGYLHGYVSRIGVTTAELFVDNVLSGEQETNLIEIDTDGFFTVKVALVHPVVPYLRLRMASASFLLSPGEATFVMIDLERKHTPRYMGANARLSTELSDPQLKVRSFNYNEANSLVGDMTPEDYKAYCLDIQTRDLRMLDSLYHAKAVSDRFYQYMQAETKVSTASYIQHYHYNHAAATKKNPQEVVMPADPAFYHFVTNDLLTDDLTYVTNAGSGFVNALKFGALLWRNGFRYSQDILEVLERLEMEPTPEEKELLARQKALEAASKDFSEQFGREYGAEVNKWIASNMELVRGQAKVTQDFAEVLEYVKANKPAITPEEVRLIDLFLVHFRSPELNEINQFRKENSDKLANIREKYATEAAIDFSLAMADFRDSLALNLPEMNLYRMNELFLLQDILSKVREEMTPLSDPLLATLSDRLTDPFFKRYLEATNEATKAAVAANQNNEGYVVHDAPTAKADAILEEIIAPFKGKVLYLDFWATWCGPCRGTMKQQAPMKERLMAAGKDVVFVYITNPSSPEATYNNMIPTIKGEHFRLTQDQWNYLASKFNINGIPHYAIVNKKGEVVDYNAPREPSVLEPRFEKLLAETNE